MNTVGLKMLSKYENQYIALSEDRKKILSTAKTIKELEKKLEKMKVEKAIIDFIPALNVSLSLLCQ